MPFPIFVAIAVVLLCTVLEVAHTHTHSYHESIYAATATTTAIKQQRPKQWHGMVKHSKTFDVALHWRMELMSYFIIIIKCSFESFKSGIKLLCLSRVDDAWRAQKCNKLQWQWSRADPSPAHEYVHLCLRFRCVGVRAFFFACVYAFNRQHHYTQCANAQCT